MNCIVFTPDEVIVPAGRISNKLIELAGHGAKGGPRVETTNEGKVVHIPLTPQLWAALDEIGNPARLLREAA